MSDPYQAIMVSQSQVRSEAKRKTWKHLSSEPEALSDEGAVSPALSSYATDVATSGTQHCEFHASLNDLSQDDSPMPEHN
jgi:hypothetical protein